MFEAPERIWIKEDYYGWGQYGHWYAHGKGGGTEYAPANHIKQLTATNKELEAKLAKALELAEEALYLDGDQDVCAVWCSLWERLEELKGQDDE